MAQIVVEIQKADAKPQEINKSRLATNIVANIANFSVTTLVALWLTPYLIAHLGVANYGLIPLAVMITSYMGLLTLGLNAAIGRYLTIALESDDEENAGRIFNTAFFGSLFLVVILVGPAIWFGFNVGSFLRLPDETAADVKLLFVCTMIMFLISTLGTAFESAIFSKNRFEIRSIVNIISNLTRLICIIALFNLALPRLWHVGIGFISAALFSLFGFVIAWRSLLPKLHLRPANFNWSTLKNLTGTGGWIVINQVGALLLLSVDLIIVNRLLGPLDGGHYAAVRQFAVLLTGMAWAVNGVFYPTVFGFYAREDISGLIRYIGRAIKILGIILVLPICLISGLARPILTLWLGEEMAFLTPLLILLTLPLCVNMSLLPLRSLQMATNKVRLPAIVTCILGVGNILLAFWLIRSVAWGMYGMAAAGAIMLTALNICFIPLYGAHILGVKAGAFYRTLAPIVIQTLCMTGICWWLSTILSLTSWPRLLTFCVVVTTVYLLAIWVVYLDAEERGLILAKLPFRRELGIS